MIIESLSNCNIIEQNKKKNVFQQILIVCKNIICTTFLIKKLNYQMLKK